MGRVNIYCHDFIFMPLPFSDVKSKRTFLGDLRGDGALVAMVDVKKT